MSKYRNLRNQMLNALCKCTFLHHSKRANRILLGKDLNPFIYSLQTENNLAKFIKSFARFMKYEFPEIRWVRDIRPEHFQAFIDQRSPKWSNRTVTTYKFYIRKIALMFNQTYQQCHLDVSGLIFPVKKNLKVKDHPMEEDDFYLLCADMINNSKSTMFVPLITYTIGSRVEELTSIEPKHIRLDKNVVELRNCKNGRNRDVPIREEYRLLWEEIKSFLEKNDWPTAVNGIKVKEVMNQIGKSKRRIGITYKYPFEGNHCIRKLYARRRFSQEFELLLRAGYSPEETALKAFSTVQVELGHGDKNREELFRVYIGHSLKSFLKMLEAEEIRLENGRFYEKKTD